jgi:hypothetical protein
MNSVDGLAGVFARIGAIDGRFVPASAPGRAVAIEAAPFDPFGEMYQAAVAAVDRGSVGPAAWAPSPMPALAQRASWAPAAVPMASTAAPSDGVLTESQVARAIEGVAGPPGARQIGGYGSMPVPGELAAYGNGQVPADALSPIGQPGHRLFAPAAASWQNLVAAAGRDGFDLSITDSYRSYEQQVDLADRKGLYRNGGLAAVPGTSNHGWGLAVDADVRDPALLDWMRTNAPRYGWVEASPREPWHWEFRPAQV